MKGMIAGALALTALLAGGGLLWKHFNQPLDWPFMENPFPEIGEVSDMAELVEFSWHQGAMNYDYSFDFEIRTTEQEPGVPRLCCDYTDRSAGERVQIGDEDNIEACPAIPAERWEELAEFLRGAELPPYSPPPPDLLDATISRIRVTWREDGEQFTNSYGGEAAQELLELLEDIAEEVNSQ